MPSMRDIYQHGAAQYDELVKYEDYQNHLRAAMQKIVDLDGKTVVEFGTGTGRVTSLYIRQVERAYCWDDSEHMLKQARVNLHDQSDKIVTIGFKKHHNCIKTIRDALPEQDLAVFVY